MAARKEFRFHNQNWAKIFEACAEQARVCPEKCGDAVSLAIFMKDVVNLKLGQPLYDEANFAQIFNHLSDAYKQRLHKGRYLPGTLKEPIEIVGTEHPTA